MEGELRRLAVCSLFMRVLVEVIDPAGIKGGGAPLDPMNLVPLLQEELSQIAAILPRDAGDQGGFGRNSGHGGELKGYDWGEKGNDFVIQSKAVVLTGVNPELR